MEALELSHKMEPKSKKMCVLIGSSIHFASSVIVVSQRKLNLGGVG